MKIHLLFLTAILILTSCKNNTMPKNNKYYLTIYKHTKYNNSSKMSEIELTAENDSIAFNLAYNEFCEKLTAFYYVYKEVKVVTSVPYKFILEKKAGEIISNNTFTKYNIKADYGCDVSNLRQMITKMTPNLK